MLPAAIVAFLASTTTVVSQALMPLLINTPASLSTCNPVEVTWRGGVAPYYLTVMAPGSIALRNFGPLGSPDAHPATVRTFIWTVDLAASQPVFFSIGDSTGAQSYTPQLTIARGSDGCFASPSASRTGEYYATPYTTGEYGNSEYSNGEPYSRTYIGSSGYATKGGYATTSDYASSSSPSSTGTASPTGVDVPTTTAKAKSNAGLIAGVVVGVVALLIILAALLFFLRKRKRTRPTSPLNIDDSPMVQPYPQPQQTFEAYTIGHPQAVSTTLPKPQSLTEPAASSLPFSMSSVSSPSPSEVTEPLLYIPRAQDGGPAPRPPPSVMTELPPLYDPQWQNAAEDDDGHQSAASYNHEPVASSSRMPSSKPAAVPEVPVKK